MLKTGEVRTGMMYGQVLYNRRMNISGSFTSHIAVLKRLVSTYKYDFVHMAFGPNLISEHMEYLWSSHIAEYGSTG